jgi:hypothetical protein
VLFFAKTYLTLHMQFFKLFIFCTLCAAIFSCKKQDSFITSPTANVTTSADTLKYDTVFTSAGSVTKVVKIFNNNKQKIKFSTIQLMGGNASFFKMNVDGLPGIQFTNVEVAANDSIYVYVTVNINPSAAPLPFVVRDSVQIQYNGTKQFVQLQAYGQNAIFLNGTTITTNTTWNNTLPYVILGSLTVAPNATLTINKATKIYSHANAPFIVKGTLVTNGEKWDSTKVVFQGDRLDEPYNSYPGGWPGILFTASSKNNVLTYAVVKNAYQAIVLDSASTNGLPKITLNQTIIDNGYDAGIISIGSSITATNCLISNCGKNVAIAYGGTYNFNHCTIASFSNSNVLHKDAVLIATNYVKQSNNSFLSNNMAATFTNCIFWGEFGTAEDEVLVDKQGATPFNFTLNKCIYKVKTILNPIITTVASLANTPPQFDSINTSRSIYNFRLKATSPAVNTGVVTSTNIDLDGKLRPIGLPDMGCYEKQ